MAMFAWFLLVLSCAGLAVGLSTGRPVVDPRAASVLSGVAERLRNAAASPSAPASAYSDADEPGRRLPPEGWYEDRNEDVLRWWDGRQWTEEIRPLP